MRLQYSVALQTPGVPELMRRVLLCMLEAVEGGHWAQFQGFEIDYPLWQFSRYKTAAQRIP